MRLAPATWRRLARACGAVAAWCWEQAQPRWSFHDDGLRYRGRKFGGEPVAWKTVVRADPCTYCGAPSDTVEHVTPTSRGGRHGHMNEVGACRACNEAKANRPLLQFLLERHRATRPVPRLPRQTGGPPVFSKALVRDGRRAWKAAHRRRGY